MIEILEFAFSSFWTWLGCLVFLCVICGCATEVRLVGVTLNMITQRGAGARADVKDRK